MASLARRLHALVEPIHLVTYTDPPYEEFVALGLTNYWDGYFASRTATVGRVPAEVVHAVFYNFGPGEAARHIPRVWGRITPEEALAARERGCVRALRERLGELADGPAVTRAADLAMTAARSAPLEGRPIFAGLRTLPDPPEPLARLYLAATMLREHRGDGHNAALLTHGIGGIEAHALYAVSIGMPAKEFGRIHHLPDALLDGVLEGMRERGLIDADGLITEHGRVLREEIEEVTDRLAEPAYAALTGEQVEALVDALTPIAARLNDV